MSEFVLGCQPYIARVVAEVIVSRVPEQHLHSFFARVSSRKSRRKCWQFSIGTSTHPCIEGCLSKMAKQAGYPRIVLVRSNGGMAASSALPGCWSASGRKLLWLHRSRSQSLVGTSLRSPPPTSPTRFGPNPSVTSNAAGPNKRMAGMKDTIKRPFCGNDGNPANELWLQRAKR